MLATPGPQDLERAKPQTLPTLGALREPAAMPDPACWEILDVQGFPQGWRPPAQCNKDEGWANCFIDTDYIDCNESYRVNERPVPQVGKPAQRWYTKYSIWCKMHLLKRKGLSVNHAHDNLEQFTLRLVRLHQHRLEATKGPNGAISESPSRFLRTLYLLGPDALGARHRTAFC